MHDTDKQNHSKGNHIDTIRNPWYNSKWYTYFVSENLSIYKKLCHVLVQCYINLKVSLWKIGAILHWSVKSFAKVTRLTTNVNTNIEFSWTHQQINMLQLFQTVNFFQKQVGHISPVRFESLFVSEKTKQGSDAE